jgi:hypothetical protein
MAFVRAAKDKFKMTWKRISTSGPGPATASYNASFAKIYNAASSLVRLETKIFSSALEKPL